ncbi:uncharacterized protein [Elaeis guineensis]|uniref:uncharacterized protein n=1 Tax=Elaeis guineensis var. tenera TaxID=51953 RepID=UPI003C6D3C4E
MTPSRTVKEVQRLTGKVTSLNHFIFRSAVRCLPFFQILKQPKDFQWTTECQKVFKELKQYLSSASLLMKPQPGEVLLLYLAVSPVTISSVLVREEGWIRKSIYYANKVLHDIETRYFKLEKLIFILVITMRKLWPYFQAHTIVLLADQPIKTVLYDPDTSGRIAKPSIKAQVLADFILECTIPNGRSSESGENLKNAESSNEELNVGADPEELWILHVDGSSNSSRSGAGLILTDLEGDVAEYALHFELSTTNNEAEYEALNAGIKVTKEAGAQRLKVFSDSQLVVGQIKSRYEA